MKKDSVSSGWRYWSRTVFFGSRQLPAMASDSEVSTTAVCSASAAAFFCIDVQPPINGVLRARIRQQRRADVDDFDMAMMGVGDGSDSLAQIFP